MALEMGAGNYDKAIALAQKIFNDPNNPDKALSTLLISLSQFKEGKFDESLKSLEQYKNDALSVAILPLIKAWAEAGKGKANIDSLKDSPSLIYQSVLLAAYAKDTAAISQLAANNDFTKTPTPITRLEDVAAIFAYYNEKTEALEIYKALKTGLPERVAFYDEKIKAIESGAPLELPKQTTSPQIGLSEAICDMAQILSNGYSDSSRLFAQMSIYLNPSNSSAYELLAEIAADNKLYTEATDYLSKIDTSQSPDKKIQVTRQIAFLQLSAGHPDEAIRILKDLVESQNNVDAQIQIGDIYRSIENFEDALTAYNKAYEMVGNNITAPHWELSFARGITNERLKNWDAAEKDLKTALMFQPDQPYILNYLGYSWADQGVNLDKAAEMIEKAVRLKPDDGAIVDSLGWIYFRMGQYDKAVIVLERASQLAPTEPEINDHLGDAYWRVGRKSEARFQWSRATSFTKDTDMISKIQTKIDNGLPAAEVEKK
jgi:tetratricopeptide (TPR) repeat protein